MKNIQEILKGTKYNETQIEYFLAECYLDFIYFAKHVLGFAIASYHKEWYELLEKCPRLCLIAFRGSGKTSFVGGYYIWKALFKENLNFLIVSATFDQSKIVLKVIRKMIVDNEILKHYIPDNRESTWKATELTLKTGATFYCKTYGESVKGLRIDYALCDEAQEYEDKTIFWTAISPTVQLNRGNIIVIGTKKSTIDLLSELEDNEQYFSKEYPIVVENKVLWPQRYTLEENDTLTQRSIPQIRKELGLLAYNQEFLLIPISSANSLFPYELCSQGLSNEGFLPYGKPTEKYYLGYDMASSPKGDFVVMTVLGVNADKKRIARALRFRDNFEEQKKKIRQLYTDFPIKKGIADASGLGDQQAKELHEEFPNLEPKKSTYDDKMAMMTDLRNEFDKFSIVIPNGKDPKTKEITDMNAYGYSQELLKELNEFSLKIDLRPGQTTRPKFHKGKYDDCLLEGTLITTNKGQKPIEEIRVGDLVLTRKGFRKVTRAWLKSDNAELFELKFNDGRTLIGTNDHKIFTKEKGFISMDTMSNIYKPVDALTYAWEKILQLNLMENPITKIKEQDIGAEREENIFYTEMFGNFITEIYQKDMIFTTKIPINQIMTSKILNVFPEKNIPININGQKKDMKNKKHILIELDPSQKNGTNQKQEKNGTKNTGKKVLEIKENQLKKYVRYVLKNLRIIRFNSQENIALTNVNKKHIELKTKRKLNYTGKVYDLTVEEEHEFFANGILVHNCVDSLAFALKASQEIYGEVSIRGIE